MIMHAQSLIPGVGPFVGDAHDALSGRDRGARQLFAAFVFFASRAISAAMSRLMTYATVRSSDVAVASSQARNCRPPTLSG